MLTNEATATPTSISARFSVDATDNGTVYIVIVPDGVTNLDSGGGSHPVSDAAILKDASLSLSNVVLVDSLQVYKGADIDIIVQGQYPYDGLLPDTAYDVYLVAENIEKDAFERIKKLDILTPKVFLQSYIDYSPKILGQPSAITIWFETDVFVNVSISTPQIVLTLPGFFGDDFDNMNDGQGKNSLKDVVFVYQQ